MLVKKSGQIHQIKLKTILKMAEISKVHQELNKLILLIKKLRAPDGCPWDRKQNQEDIGKYILEEAYEVIESLERKDQKSTQEELGDLLFLILFLADMGEESGAFSLDKIMSGVREKMIRRHPHIFGTVKADSAEEVRNNWQQIKIKERDTKAKTENLFQDVPRSLPALKRAQKITALAAAYGFDWKESRDVMKKVREELNEFDVACKNKNQDKMEEELGDLFFTLVNLSRFIKADAETVLGKSTNKFMQRFNYISDQLSARGKSMKEATMEEMDALWDEAKKIGM